MIAVLQRAVVFGRFGTEDVRSILAAGAVVPPRHQREREVLTLDTPSVPTRSLDAYAWPA